MAEKVFLKVSSAFLIGGQLAKAGDVVEVPMNAAKDLLARGKATVATQADEKPVAAIHYSDELHVSKYADEAAAKLDAAPEVAEAPADVVNEAPDEAPAKPKRSKKAK